MSHKKVGAAAEVGAISLNGHTSLIDLVLTSSHPRYLIFPPFLLFLTLIIGVFTLLSAVGPIVHISPANINELFGDTCMQTLKKLLK